MSRQDQSRTGEIAKLLQSEDDPRAAFRILPDPDSDGYLVTFSTSDQKKTFRVDYETGGEIFDNVFRAANQDPPNGRMFQ